ncbi:bifunctional adenosylcobinamide kinase/adenosylcobinamide-phosphate guanylyltransferase [Amycolatopsis sp. MtRt-6]|uniref:bifunctional adenosylcobinamide kinase/adenosylcobinamide-phosphate guanylyltransferase n=1 Tax=Amycolatopsis sp. MtRt-6 TaxID=2792782 RepID=UPI001A8D0BF3|nr:bifunctional adenosylcobinamide kinase/adenosylcobinamide-phosphate guanylyltransferase [Amycolatopsis sp. MtRt-6]
MSRVFVTGAARSGKSHWAEQRAAGAGLPVTYVATGPAPSPDDPEWAERVAAHRRRRPASWTTVETLDLGPLLARTDTILLVDCLTLWLTEAMSRCDVWDAPTGSEPWQRLASWTDRLVEAWSAASAPAIAVTNETGWGVVPAHRMGRLFRDELGTLNRRIAAVSDEAWLVVAGIPMQLK